MALIDSSIMPEWMGGKLEQPLGGMTMRRCAMPISKPMEKCFRLARAMPLRCVVADGEAAVTRCQ